ncbi:MAG: cation diffusion facilitator family transporter [Coriobacteriaceae bacterium]|nr:cation diffusion facilitator family transporter [Coriobacteriaceae bacterium]
MKNKAILTALAANSIIAVMKFAVAFISGSASMFSEGIHSVADAMNQVVLLFGKRKARKAPDKKHPFGHARATFFASFLVATLLFFVGGAYSLMEAIEKISHINEGVAAAHDPSSYIIAVVILAISIALEGYSLRVALHEVKEQQELDGTNKGIFAFFKETRNSSLIVILTEDFAAMLGLIFALAGVSLTLITNNLLFDAIGGAAIGVLLIVAAGVLGREIASLIIGESLPDAQLTRIKELVENTDHVLECRRIKTVAIGANAVLVEADVVFSADGSVSAAEVMTAITQIKAAIKGYLSSEDTYVSTCVEAVAPSALVDTDECGADVPAA